MAPAPTLGWARLHGHRLRFWETQENKLSSPGLPDPVPFGTTPHSPPALPSAQKACRPESKMQGAMGCTAPGGTAERFTGAPRPRKPPVLLQTCPQTRDLAQPPSWPISASKAYLEPGTGLCLDSLASPLGSVLQIPASGCSMCPRPGRHQR